MQKQIAVILLIAILLMVFLDVIGDRIALKSNVIRLHVVANSDLKDDQAVKLKVKDAVCTYLNGILKNVDSKKEAGAQILSNIDKIEAIANNVLETNGSQDAAEALFGEESFPMREYDTFTMPAGVYDSLMIRIGTAQGRNWWCVAFPSLCIAATTKEFEEDAACAGFDSDLAATLSNEKGYKVRFFLLDCLGKVENFFFRRN